MALGLFCWLAAVPCWQTRTAVLKGGKTPSAYRQKIARLGGPREAERKICFYLRLPLRLRPCPTEAVFLLGACGPEAVPALLGLLKDRDGRLPENDDPDYERKYGDFQIHGAVHTVLMRMGEPAVAPLIGALGDKHERVRLEAAWALMRIGDPRAVEPVCLLLGDQSEIVRLAAVYCLGKLKDPRAIGPLETALQDEDPTVRQAAAGALTEIREARKVEK